MTVSVGFPTRSMVVTWLTGVAIALATHTLLFAQYDSGTDPRYILAQEVSLAVSPASFAWVAEGQWQFENKWPLLVFVPAMNGFVYSGIGTMIVSGWRRRWWLAVLGITLVAGWFVLIAVDYSRWMDLLKSGAAEEQNRVGWAAEVGTDKAVTLEAARLATRELG